LLARPEKNLNVVDRTFQRLLFADQVPRERNAFGCRETFDNLEGYAGDADQKNGSDAIGRTGHLFNRMERTGSDKRKSLRRTKQR
jgi:hypothetical protein